MAQQSNSVDQVLFRWMRQLALRLLELRYFMRYYGRLE